MITDQLLQEAIDRLARTADGHLLYLYLQRRLMAVSGAGGKSGALREDKGERMFAAKLIGLMAKGIEESGRATPDRAITFAVAGPRAVVASARGAGRRVTADTHVAGYDDAG